MGAEIGRISGPLLSANLLRNGVDLAFETDLLYIDVNNGLLGVNTDTPVRTINVSGTSAVSELLIDARFDVANIEFLNNTIQNVLLPIYLKPNQLLDPKIVVVELQTQHLKVVDNVIENTTTNSNIEVTANGTGTIEFRSSIVNVNGNLHATGNITFDGDVIFGSDDSDSIILNSDVASNIIPDDSAIYDLGSTGKVWNTLYSDTVTASNSITVASLTVDDVDLLLTQGNTIYVSINGTDTNTGEHLHSTFRTIKHALSVAQPADEIIIFPGTYIEEFPLTVPSGVVVKGFGIRSVTISPTEETKFNDCFLLNGDSTVEFLSVKHFYYNPLTDTGYAFRFAPNARVVARSPYIQNVTVITHEDIIDSPSGLLTILAGRGALADGSAVAVDSKEASLLFFSTTFIVPNADGITATNGARVEWLNSFTYYANRGIYLTTGTLGFASQGIRFGAEMRSINSANIYGTYGAVADGPDTLGYLIGHNFGYIGTGTNNLNDRSLSIQANEVVAFNQGVIYYDSMDHKGDYRIGDVFYINQETGNVLFDAQAINFGATGSIGLEGVDGVTLVNAQQVQASNIKVYSNNIDSLAGAVNLLAASGLTYLNTNVNVLGAVDVTGNTVIKGNVYLGNDEFDLISLAPNLTQDIYPGTTGLTLGKDDLTAPKFWNTLYLSNLDIDAVIQIDSNAIVTLTDNTDLVLEANGTGIIQVSTTDVDIDNQLLVTDTAFLQNTDIVGDITHTGDVVQIGGVDKTGNTDITGSLTVDNSDTINSEVQFQDISVDSNIITTTLADSNLEVIANGTGIVNIINNVLVNNDLTISIAADFNTVEVTTTLEGDVFDISDVYITDNYITTLDENQNLILEANGTGIISVPLKDVLITNKLSVNDVVTAKSISVTGNIIQVGDVDQTGNIFRTGNTEVTGNLTVTTLVKFEDVEFNTNTLKTTLLNNNLQFQANGAGIVKTNTTDVLIDTGLTVQDTGNLNVLEVIGTAAAADFDVSDVYITNNYITTLGTNQNLLLQANGSGIISVPLKDILISNNLTVNNLTAVKDLTIEGDISHLGDYTQLGNIERIGNTDLTGTLTVNSTLLIASVVNIGTISVDENVVTTSGLNTDLEFYANGAGIVTVPLNDVEITNNLTVIGTSFLNTLNVTNTITADDFDVSDVYITDNYITSLGENQNLILQAEGSSLVLIELNDVRLSNLLKVEDTSYVQNLTIEGLLTHTGTVQQLGNVERIGNTDLTGNLTVTEVVNFFNIEFNSNVIASTLLNSNLVLDSNGAGVVETALSDVIIENNLTVTASGFFNSVEIVNTVEADVFDISDVYITDNYITTLGENQNLLLQADGNGVLSILLNNVSISNNLTVNDLIVNGSTDIQFLEIDSNLLQTGNWLQTGDIQVTGTFANGNIVGIGATSTLEVTSILIDGNQVISTTTDADLILSANGTGNVLLNSWLKVSTNEISNIKLLPTSELEQSIYLEPNGLGNTIVDSKTAMAIPVGSNSTRILASNGELRFNNTSSLFEGYQESGTVSLYGVYDQDRNTFITPELTQGLNDNILRFVIDNTLKASIDNVALKTNSLHIDNVKILANSISSLDQMTDISFISSITAQTKINNVSIYDNEIYNNTDNVLTFSHIGTGYLKFSGTNGVVIPNGETNDRRDTPELGEVRNNTQLGYVEVWSGTNWIPVIGVTEQATLAEVGEISDEWSLILG